MAPVELKNHVSRDGFDLSRKVCFTAKFGQILPLIPKQLYPGDKVKVRLQEFTRTLPVNTAAFARMRHYFDFYFVPNRLLWRDFPSFVTSMANTAKQATSIGENRKVGQELPYATAYQVHKFIKALEDATGDGTNKAHINPLGFNRGSDARRLISHLGNYYLGAKKPDFGKQEALSPQNNVGINLFFLLAYQKVYNDYFRYTQWEEEQSNTYNIDYLQAGEEIPIQELSSVVFNREPNMFDLRYANYNKDMFLGVLPNRQYGAKSTVTGSIDISNRALSMVPFNIGFRKINSTNPMSPSNFPVGIARENWDDATDMYMSFNPKTGKNEGIYINGNGGYTPYIDLADNYFKSGMPGSNGKKVPNDFLHALSNAYDSTFSILALRAGEAVQKFREIALTNGQDYKSQIEAHFGVKVSSIVSGLCTYIGGVSHDISVNEVVNQMLLNTDRETYGANLAGKGMASGNGFVEFEAKEHGVFICMYHATVLPDYAVQGYERDNLRLSFSDFPIPEFDRLGMEPVPQVLLTGRTDGYTGSPDPADSEVRPLGYAPRYFDLKTSYDILLGGFNPYFGGTLQNWVTPIDPKQLLPNRDPSTTLPFNLYADYWSFKVNPHVVDNLFVAKADDSYDSDPLHVTAFFDIKAVRNFNRSGLPY